MKRNYYRYSALLFTVALNQHAIYHVYHVPAFDLKAALFTMFSCWGWGLII